MAGDPSIQPGCPAPRLPSSSSLSQLIAWGCSVLVWYQGGEADRQVWSFGIRAWKPELWHHSALALEVQTCRVRAATGGVADDCESEMSNG